MIAVHLRACSLSWGRNGRRRNCAQYSIRGMHTLVDRKVLVRQQDDAHLPLGQASEEAFFDLGACPLAAARPQTPVI